MVGLDHGGVTGAEERTPAVQRQHARWGLMLFGVYCALYATFMWLVAFDLPRLAINIGGVNLALVYGLVLIGAAIFLAFLYGWLCRARQSVDREARS